MQKEEKEQTYDTLEHIRYVVWASVGSVKSHVLYRFCVSTYLLTAYHAYAAVYFTNYEMSQRPCNANWKYYIARRERTLKLSSKQDRHERNWLRCVDSVEL